MEIYICFNNLQDNESKNMNKKLIKLTEQDLHRIVKESVGKILKEGYYDDLHDYWGQEDEPNLICPYCESDNVQEVRGKDGSWDGSCRCYDCGKVFDIDSARGNNYFEPDWDAMRHESLKRNGKMLKEMDLNPRMSTHDVYGRGLSRKSEGPNWSRQRRRPMTQQQNLGGVNMDAVNKVLFPDETPHMAKDQLKRRAQYGLMNPPSVKESNLHNIVKESVNKIINESLYQDSYDWTLSTLDRRLKKHSIEDVVSFAKKELQFMDNMVHRMNGQDKGQYDAYRDFVLKYQH